MRSSPAKGLKTALKQYVLAHFGESNPAIGDFGYAPRKVAQKTVAEKLLTFEKQLATRAARHTMGSKAKAAIHGQVETPTPQPASVTSQLVTTNGNVLSLIGSSH